MVFWRAVIPALFVFCSALPAGAQGAGDTGGVPVDALKEALGGGEFGGRAEERWALRPKDEAKNAPAAPPAGWLDFFNKIASHLARALIIMLVSALLVVCVIFGRKIRPFHRRKSAVRVDAEAAPPRAAPEELVAEARRAFDEGRVREAWTYCYLSALCALEEAGLSLPPSATEYECLASAAKRFPAITLPLRTLVENRVKNAYQAGKTQPSVFIECAQFCRELSLGRQGGVL
jgi:hypothetical protein